MAEIERKHDEAMKQAALLEESRRREKELWDEKKRAERRAKARYEQEQAETTAKWGQWHQRGVALRERQRQRPIVAPPKPTMKVYHELPEVQFASRKRKREVVLVEERAVGPVSPWVVNAGFAAFGLCVWVGKWAGFW
jgi:hypothetical protein